MGEKKKTDWLLAGEELDTQQEEAQFLRMAVVKGARARLETACGGR